MRRPSWVKRSGPYKVVSLANGELTVTPTWPQYPPWNEEDGGGPGLWGRLGLAGDLEKWLNAPYSSQSIGKAK